MSGIDLQQDQELPGIGIEWRDRLQALVDFSGGLWTFTAKIALASAPLATLLTKTTGITGAATVPNVQVDFAAGELAALAAAPTGTLYLMHMTARRVADSKDRVFRRRDPIRFTLWPSPT